AMIARAEKEKRVTFTGDRMSDHATVRSLIEALESALIWLRGRDPDSTVDWEIVRVSIGKRLSLTFSSPNANGNISVRMKNLHELQKKRAPKVSPRLTDEDVDGTKQLASMIGGEFKSMRISSPGAPTVRLTPSLVQRVEEIAGTQRGAHYEWGTIRGVLDQITVGSSSCRFRLKHQLTGAEISCTTTQERLDEVKDALPHRVEVYGRIRFNRANQPKSVEVEKIDRKSTR